MLGCKWWGWGERWKIGERNLQYKTLSTNECCWIYSPTIPTSLNFSLLLEAWAGCGALGSQEHVTASQRGPLPKLYLWQAVNPTMSYVATRNFPLKRYTEMVGVFWLKEKSLAGYTEDYNRLYSCYSCPQCHCCFLSLILRFLVWHFHSKVWTWTQWLLNHHSGHKQPSSSRHVVPPPHPFFPPLICLNISAQSAVLRSKNGLNVITNSVTSLLKPVIPSWLRWWYWFDWDCMQINRDIGRSVVFQFAVCLWFHCSSQVSPTHMVWLQDL